MLIQELYELGAWLQANVVKAQIPQKYQALHQKLHHNATQAQKQPFEDVAGNLDIALREIPTSELSKGQLDVLSEIGIAEYIGVSAAETVSEVLYKNAIDVATAAERMKQAHAQLNAGIEWLQAEHKSLKKIVRAEQEVDIRNKTLLRVHFGGEASLKNITDLRDWSEKWWEISRGIAIAHGEPPESIEIVGASKGSIIVSLLVAHGIALSVSGILLASLKVAEKYYEIKKTQQEVRALQLSNDSAERALEQEAKKILEEGVKDVTEQAVADLQAKNEVDTGDVPAIRKAVDRLLICLKRRRGGFRFIN